MIKTWFIESTNFFKSKKMKRLFLAFLLFTALLSCKKEKTEPNCPAPDTPDFVIPSTIGSYWVYEIWATDSLGITTQLPYSDSVTLIGTEDLNGHTYLKYYGEFIGSASIWYQRDSSGYIVDNYGKILYSYHENIDIADYSEPITMIRTQVRMGSNTTITIPVLGTVGVLDKQTELSKTDGSVLTACNDYTYTFNSYYASGIGEVQSTLAFWGGLTQQCKILKRELVAYHIAP